MTAERWWVRYAARWLARIDGVSGQLRLAMLGLTGISTASLTLKQYGHGQYAWPLIITLSLGMLVYTYLYAEGGVWNQVSRDRADLATNYAGPTMKMDDEIIGAAVFAAMHGRPPEPEEYDAIRQAVDQPWQEYRHGINLDENGQQPNTERTNS